MIPPLRPGLVSLLTALPHPGQQRLIIMGWSADGPTGVSRRLRDPERALRRAVGGPQYVSLVDLELDPERWHGRFLVTSGPLTWQKRPFGAAGLGRLWVDTTVMALVNHGPRAVPVAPRARVVGVLLADPQVRAAHQAAHKEPGGYGLSGLFIAQLSAVAIHAEDPTK